jgi:hypothetical protein
MNATEKIELVKSWGFQPYLSNDHTFSRPAPQGFTEWWSIDRPDYIEFTKDGKPSHDWKIDWSIFQK